MDKIKIWTIEGSQASPVHPTNPERFREEFLQSIT